MRNGKVAKFLFAALTGVMLMAAPTTAMAYSYDYDTEAVDAAVPAVANLRVMYQNGQPYVTFDNVLTDDDYGDQTVIVEWSETDQFPDDETTEYTWVYAGDFNMKSLYNVDPGKTYYVRAFVRQRTYSYEDAEGNWVDSTTKYGPVSNVITYTASVPDVSIGSCEVSSSSVAFTFGAGYDWDNDYYRDYAYVNQYNWDNDGDGVNDSYSYSYEEDADYQYSQYGTGNVTGFEIYRAAGSGKYTKIATVADTAFTDKNLKSNTNYRYKIRAYALNAAGEKVYGEYTYRRVTTWGKALEVKATLKGSSSVRLKWNKVTGADGYQIYRYVGGATSSTVKNGSKTSFSNYQLVKTITKAKTTSYTDKKLTSGESYSYIVKAYKKVNGSKKTMNIEGYAGITLGFNNNFYFDTEVEQANGSVVATWNKVYGADGYVVEKQDPKTDVWTSVGTLAADATTCTFSATAEEKSAYYRIYAYDGNNISSYQYVSASYVQTVDRTTGITATANADHAGVTVSWAPVQGAAYYKVYRSRQIGTYNADKGYYNIPNSVTVQVLEKAGKLDSENKYWETYPKYTSMITGTSVVDTYQGYQYTESKWDEATQTSVDVVKTEEIQEAPAMGVRYYYYVQAFALDGTPIIEKLTDTEWDDETGKYKEVEYGTRTECYYRGGLSGKPASVVIENVSLKAPKISKVTSTKKGKAIVSWKKVTGASKYYVYYSTKKSSGYTFAGITSKTKLTVSGLKSGKKYYFKVKACTSNVAGADVYSSLSKAANKKVK